MIERLCEFIWNVYSAVLVIMGFVIFGPTSTTQQRPLWNVNVDLHVLVLIYQYAVCYAIQSNSWMLFAAQLQIYSRLFQHTYILYTQKVLPPGNNSGASGPQGNTSLQVTSDASCSRGALDINNCQGAEDVTSFPDQVDRRCCIPE